MIIPQKTKRKENVGAQFLANKMFKDENKEKNNEKKGKKTRYKPTWVKM